MKIKSFLVLAVWLSSVWVAFGQGNGKFLDNLGVSLKASPTLGYGLDVSTKFHKMLILRAGLQTTAGIALQYVNYEFEDSDELLNAFGYMPWYRAKMNLGITHGNILLDFHPGGVFHITTGIFIGSFQIKYPGYYGDFDGNKSVLLPGRNWPSINIDGTQKMEFNNGKADVALQKGNLIKPYFGLGVGHAVPKKKVSFKFELGALYQGDAIKAK